MNTIQCPECQHEISLAGTLPRFCSACGTSLESITSSLRLDGKPDSNRLDHTTDLSRPVSENQTPNSQGKQSTVDATSAPPQELPPGTLIGHFQVEKTLGSGGMGTVYQAIDQSSGQTVALKLLARSVRSSDESVQRFQRESQIAASINHPRSTFVYGAGQHEDRFYITMELMTGGTLDDIVKRQGPIELGKAVDYVLDIIDGLRAAHEAGIVHRDLKPSNCFLDHSGRVKIGDYGLAKSFVSDSSLTQTGAFMGTPQYAAPEQLRTSEIDERADIYAIGGTLFYLLVGRPPFVGNAAQVISSIASENAPRISSLLTSVPRQLCQVINQTLEKDPNRRPESLYELRDALLPFSTRGSTAADPGRRMASFFLDVFIIWMVNSFFENILGLALNVNPDLFDFNLAKMVMSFVLGVTYFVASEYRYGTTFGKWLLGMRMTTTNNRAPSFLACCLRASVMPGIMYVAAGLPEVFFSSMAPTKNVSLDESLPQIAIVFFFKLGGWAVGLLSFLTARKSNGYRGLHELISDTHVVSVSGTLEIVRLEDVPITVPVSRQFDTHASQDDPAKTIGYVAPEKNGDYSIMGELGRIGNSTYQVQLARDEALDRDVWFISVPGDSEWLSDTRAQVARSTRVRVLGVQGSEDKVQLVTESIQGVPLAEYIRKTPQIDWRAFRPVLQELVSELDKATKDESLPKLLTLGQVWINSAGHIKLLEHPIVAIAAGLSSKHSADELNEKLVKGSTWQHAETPLTATGLVKSVLEQFIRYQTVPAHVLTFQQEIDVLDLEQDGLVRIEERLEELAEIPSTWKWDDRIGVIASSIGLEFTTSAMLMLGFALLVALLEPGQFFVGVTFFLAALVLAFGVGYLTSGGLVFRITGVLVRDHKTLNPASPIRCGWRNVLSWVPLAVASGFMASLFAITVRRSHEVSELINENGEFIGKVALCVFAVMLFGATCAIFAIASPSRGVQDWICGTRLIRK